MNLLHLLIFDKKCLLNLLMHIFFSPVIMIIKLMIIIFISQSSSTSFPLVLDSSEISTDTGRRSRFPRPELEISFSPLQPDRFALKRQGEDSAITVKISRPTRKRKSGEMEKVRNDSDGGGVENGS